MSDEGYELEYIHDAFQKNWIAPLGENVDKFEKAMGEFMGKGYPVALSAGTAALHLAMSLAGVKTGDTVFCQSLTFSAGGGMLLCQTEENAKHALKLSMQARENAPWYQHEEIGYNYRMSNICAGIGRGQIKVLALRVRQKQAIFKRYCEQLRDLPLSMLNGAIMFDGLFGTANYFLIFQSLSLPWMLKKIGGRDGKVLTALLVLGYAAYFYYANAINQPFDHCFARLSLAEYFAQIGRQTINQLRVLQVVPHMEQRPWRTIFPSVGAFSSAAIL